MLLSINWFNKKEGINPSHFWKSFLSGLHRALRQIFLCSSNSCSIHFRWNWVLFGIDYPSISNTFISRPGKRRSSRYLRSAGLDTFPVWIALNRNTKLIRKKVNRLWLIELTTYINKPVWNQQRSLRSSADSVYWQELLAFLQQHYIHASRREVAQQSSARSDQL